MWMMVLFAIQSLHKLGKTGRHRSQTWAEMQDGMGGTMGAVTTQCLSK